MRIWRRNKPRFLLCVLTISPGESGRYLVAPVGRGPGAKRIKRKVQWTFLPLSGFAREGEPRLSSKARTAKRRKVRVKKAWMDFFNNLLVLRPINNFIYVRYCTIPIAFLL